MKKILAFLSALFLALSPCAWSAIASFRMVEGVVKSFDQHTVKLLTDRGMESYPRHLIDPATNIRPERILRIRVPDSESWVSKPKLAKHRGR